jgi:hypothetical protein
MLNMQGAPIMSVITQAKFFTQRLLPTVFNVFFGPGRAILVKSEDVQAGGEKAADADFARKSRPKIAGEYQGNLENDGVARCGIGRSRTIRRLNDSISEPRRCPRILGLPGE